MKKVVTFGEIMLRLSAPGYLRINQCNNFDISFAGAEANVAVSLANYGISTDFITRLPNNQVSEKCVRELLSYKVDTDHILYGGKRIGLMYVETGSNARPSKVIYDREDSSFATIPINTIDWEEIFKDTCWFHWSGITPALSEQAAIVCEEAIHTAKKMGITISCDINYRNNLWKYGQKASEVMPRLIKNCDIILGNEEDCEKVFGIKPDHFDVNNTNGQVEPQYFIPVSQRMFERFPNCKKLVFTLRGAINANINSWRGVLFDNKTLYQSKVYNITDIVDRVGGGDSFMGGLIYALIMHPDNNQYAIDFATAASCLKHTIKGDFNQVSCDEVVALIEGDASGRVKR